MADIFLIANAAALVYVAKFFGTSLVSRPWKCIAFGFMFITASDVAYSYINWSGGYAAGNVIDMGWNTGYLLIGLAGFYQKELIDSISVKGPNELHEPLGAKDLWFIGALDRPLMAESAVRLQA